MLPPGWQTYCVETLERLKTKKLYRDFPLVDALSAETTITLQNQKLINFGSNDYLGLSQHPRVRRAAREVLHQWGVGSGASRAVTGHSLWHERLEKTIARFKGQEACLTFSSGYLTNVGVLSSLADADTFIACDVFCHASLIDGARLSRGSLSFFPHKDYEFLERKLRKITREGNRFRRKMIVTDALFSMEGDTPDLLALERLSQEYDALVVVDEAHAIGVLGRTGRGLEERLTHPSPFIQYFSTPGKPSPLIQKDSFLWIGTLSKAIGVQGGFVVGPRVAIETIQNQARTILYNTAMPAALCAAAVRSFELLQEEEGQTLLHTLQKNIQLFNEELWSRLGKKIPPERNPLSPARSIPPRYSLGTREPDSPIIPLIVGSSEKALEGSRKLREEKFFVPAIRPPTVPHHTARLRLSLTAQHSPASLERLAQLLENLLLPNP